MRRGTRWALGIVGGVVALLAIVATVAPFLVDADSFRPAVESALASAAGRPVTLGPLSLSLWGGPRLTAARLDVAPAPGSPPGTPPFLSGGKARVRVAVLPLLRGELDIRALTLRDAVVRSGGEPVLEDAKFHARLRRKPDGTILLAGGAKGRSPAVSDLRAELSFDLQVRDDRVVIRSVELEAGPARVHAEGTVSGVGGPGLKAQLQARGTVGRTDWSGDAGLDLTGRRPTLVFHVTSEMVDGDELGAMLAAAGGAAGPKDGGSAPRGETWISILDATGTVRADRAVFAGLEMTAVSSGVRLHGGEVTLRDAGFQLYGGRHAGSATVNASAPDLPFSIRDRFEGVDVGRLVSAFAPDYAGTIEGTGTLILNLRGRVAVGHVDRSLRGSGNLEVREGKLGTASFLSQLSERLEAAGASSRFTREDTPFDRLSASFRIADGLIRTRDLMFRSPDLDLDGRGTISLDGFLDLAVDASLSPEATGELVSRSGALSRLVDDDGRLRFPMALAGTVQAPSVQVDLARLLEKNIQRGLKGKVRGLLRRLGGKD